jgi:hypothetical protein
MDQLNDTILMISKEIELIVHYFFRWFFALIVFGGSIYAAATTYRRHQLYLEQQGAYRDEGSSRFDMYAATIGAAVLISALNYIVLGTWAYAFLGEDFTYIWERIVFDYFRGIFGFSSGAATP